MVKEMPMASITVEKSAIEVPRMVVRAVSARDLTGSSIDQWERLENNALEANAFLSPHFVLPALTHLTPQAEPMFLLVETECAEGSRLVGLAVVEHSPGTKRFPLPHLRCYRPKHSYLEGILADARCAPAVVEALFGYISRHRPRWHGLSFTRRSADSTLATVMQQAADRLGMQWYGDALFARPILRPADISGDPLASPAIARNKELIRKRKQLEKLGTCQFRVVRCGPEQVGCSETFLQLEAMGWKGQAQTALACRSNEAAFFREMIGRFATSGRALFTELVVDGRVVATTSNLISGRAAFGFKLGWHTDYARICPGKLNAQEILLRGSQELSDLEYFDACTPQGSFIEDIWPLRRSLTSGLFTIGQPASLCAWVSSRIISKLRAVKKRLRAPKP
jgi:CelD/BcsL family acetyltransferase involved in cellulose biosynthesis